MEVGSIVEYEGKKFTVKWMDENRTNLLISNEEESHSSVEREDVQETMDTKIVIKLATELGSVKIGEINLDSGCVNSHEYNMHNNHNTLYGKDVSCQKWGSAKVVGEDWVFLYYVNIFDGNTFSDYDFYYYVSVGNLYDKNGYLPEVVVGEKLEADTGKDIFMKFAQKVCEVLERG